MRRLALVMALALAGCSWTFSSAEPPCPPNGWLAGGDILLGTGAAVTGAVAAYPCVADIEQSGRARAIHCGVVAAGLALGVVYGLSARDGLRDRRRCRASAAP